MVPDNTSIKKPCTIDNDSCRHLLSEQSLGNLFLKFLGTLLIEIGSLIGRFPAIIASMKNLIGKCLPTFLHHFLSASFIKKFT